MTIYEGYIVKNRGLVALEAPPKRRKKWNYTRSYLETKISVLPGQGCTRSQVVRLIAAPYAFDRSAVSSIASPCAFDRVLCVRPHYIPLHGMRSITRNCLRNPTAQVLKRWRLGPAKATRDMRLTRHALDRAPWARAQCARSHWQGPRFHLLLNSTPLNHKLYQGPTTH